MRHRHIYARKSAIVPKRATVGSSPVLGVAIIQAEALRAVAGAYIPDRS